MTTTFDNRRKKRGFTLVEVALALMIVGVGVLTVVGLFYSGTDVGKLSTEETRMALFADSVFNGVRSVVENGHWNDLGSASFPLLPAVAATKWRNPSPIDLAALNSVVTITNIYNDGSPQGIYEGALRYRLSVRPPGQPGVPPNVKCLQMEIWPGEFGTNNNPTIYYTEYYQHGT